MKQDKSFCDRIIDEVLLSRETAIGNQIHSQPLPYMDLTPMVLVLHDVSFHRMF